LAFSELYLLMKAPAPKPGLFFPYGPGLCWGHLGLGLLKHQQQKAGASMLIFWQANG
jgi:hypothetical protein